MTLNTRHGVRLLLLISVIVCISASPKFVHVKRENPKNGRNVIFESNSNLQDDKEASIPRDVVDPPKENDENNAYKHGDLPPEILIDSSSSESTQRIDKGLSIPNTDARDTDHEQISSRREAILEDDAQWAQNVNRFTTPQSNSGGEDSQQPRPLIHPIFQSNSISEENPPHPSRKNLTRMNQLCDRLCGRWDVRNIGGISTKSCRLLEWSCGLQAGSCHQAVLDVALLWVNGSDPHWQNKKARVVDLLHRRGQWDSEYAGDTSAIFDARFRELGQLKIALRSIEKNAPWARRIFFVTDGQLPEFLDLHHVPRLRHVTHRQLFEWAGVRDLDKQTEFDPLPLFNSIAIQAMLHAIPGLSSPYVLVEDDMLIRNRVHVDALLTLERRRDRNPVQRRLESIVSSGGGGAEGNSDSDSKTESAKAKTETDAETESGKRTSTDSSKHRPISTDNPMFDYDYIEIEDDEDVQLLSFVSSKLLNRGRTSRTIGKHGGSGGSRGDHRNKVVDINRQEDGDEGDEGGGEIDSRNRINKSKNSKISPVRIIRADNLLGEDFQEEEHVKDKPAPQSPRHQPPHMPADPIPNDHVIMERVGEGGDVVIGEGDGEGSGDVVVSSGDMLITPSSDDLILNYAGVYGFRLKGIVRPILKVKEHPRVDFTRRIVNESGRSAVELRKHFPKYPKGLKYTEHGPLVLFREIGSALWDGFREEAMIISQQPFRHGRKSWDPILLNYLVGWRDFYAVRFERATLFKMMTRRNLHGVLGEARDTRLPFVCINDDFDEDAVRDEEVEEIRQSLEDMFPERSVFEW